MNLNSQYLSIKDDIDAAIADVIHNSYFIRGPYVENFERLFSALTEMKHCVSCANGTDSLFIAIKALGIKPGDEVIVPAHSWISTSEVVTLAGGRVIFCDTDADTFTIDVDQIESKISSKTVGIIPVHLYGQTADMEKIMDLSKRYGLWVVEDCAQAHLSRYKGRMAGSFGDAASFSFYPGKNLGAMGDAGALVTNDEELARKMAMFARHGGQKKGEHFIEGMNSRMDGMQAAILSVKIPHLDKWTKRRQFLANRYTKKLASIEEIQTPDVGPFRDHVWHLYVIRTNLRDELKKYLNEHQVETAINYPIALPFLPAYQSHSYQCEDFPNAFANQSRILSLPIYPEMPITDQDRVIMLIKDFFKSI